MTDEAVAYFVPKSSKAARQAGSRTPAARIVRLLGGPAETAKLAEVEPKTVYRWLTPAQSGGTGGRVPAGAQAKLVSNAPARGITLAYVDFAPLNGEAFT